MWKRGYFWSGIIGAIFFLLGAIGIVGSLGNPSDLFLVNTANIVIYSLYIILGVFLVIIFLKEKGKDDSGRVHAKPVPDSPEDVALIHRKRNLFLAFAILFGIIVDSQIWVLNNYGAGLTLINTWVIFDVVLSIVLFYFAVQLFRDKREIEKALLYTVAFYFLVEFVFGVIMGQWGQAIGNLLFAVYFIYAISAPINRKNFRIAQLVILPIAIIFGLFCASLIDNYNLTQLKKSEGLLDQTYSADNSQLAQDYALFIQANPPTATDIQNVENDASTTLQAMQQDISETQAIKAVYEKQLPNVQQQLAIEQINKISAIAMIDQQQIAVLQQLMDYAATVDFSALNKSQAQEINSMEQQVNTLQKQITNLAYKMENNE